MRIIISPFSHRYGGSNAKDYPYWKFLIPALKEKHHLIQIGVEGDLNLGCHEFKKGLSLKELTELLNSCDTFITIDSFFQHLAWYHNKKGIVLWGKSNPDIFGHSIHNNLYVDKQFFRKNQFDVWNNEKLDIDSFVMPEVVIKALEQSI
jgi:ADP-heptose:LPS heptosyltransferase